MCANRDQSVRQHNLFREQPTPHWLEGIPTGNGVLGAMAWGGPDELTFTLDRADLWLTTPRPDNALTPLDALRRFCAGSLTVNTGPAGSRFREGLDLLDAIAFRESDAGLTQWFIHATRPLLCLRLPPSGAERQFRWKPPELSDPRRRDAPDAYAGRLVAKTELVDTNALMTLAFDGKPMAAILAQIFQQGQPVSLTMRDGHLRAATRPGVESLLLVTIGCWRLPSAPSVADLRRALFDCPDWGRLADEHRHWWHAYWARSGMRLSHPGMDRLWHLGNYFLGSNARPDSPTVGLQGIWCEDGEAPWGNRLGWDLNVQATYSPIYTGNHLDLGFSLYDWYRQHLPRMQDFAKAMFGPEAEGAYLEPGTDDLGQTWLYASCGGLGAGAWVGHFFWQHYLYSGDRSFLRDYGLPVFREHLKMQRFAWRREADGQYHLRNRFQTPASERQGLSRYYPPQSPELQGLATPECPMRDTTYEIALAKFLADVYVRTLRILGAKTDELADWATDFLERVVPYPLCAPPDSDANCTLSDPGVPEFFTEWPGLETQLSHRHLSHMLMVHPLGEIHRFSPHQDLCRGRNTLSRLIVRGMGAWYGYTFPWASLMATRLGWPRRMPAFMLELLDRCVAIPFNGLIPGTGQHNYGLFRYLDPFKSLDGTITLEASMLAVTAVQDALLHGAGSYTVLAGGVPPDLDGEFWSLRSPSGDLVGGVIEQGKLVSATVNVERGGERRLAVDDQPSSWQFAPPSWETSVEAGHTVIRADVAPGQTVALRRDGARPSAFQES
ncbi:MAG: glycoside hydrolase N-terminal domain-containing protein [Kiritimatiellae bacterium]|nr:glycoside hydrolase N-terminal domain-containing protein [Kiritimatiellia bacterium]